MKKTVDVDYDEEGNGFVNIENFKDMFDIEKIVYYELKTEDENIVISFYDKDKKPLKPKSSLSSVG